MMYVSERVVFVFCVIVSQVFARRHPQGCVLDVNTGNTKYQPLLLYNRTTHFELIIPERGNINLDTGDRITLACTGPRNYITATNSNSTYATCIRGNTLKIVKNDMNFDSLQCHKQIKGSVRKTRKKCANGKGFITDIGYQVTRTSWVTLIKTCYNESEGVTFYTEHLIYGSEIKYSEKTSNRPSFSTEGSELIPSSAYTKVFQKGIFNSLLKSARLAEIYINNKSSIARGHLSPDADFLDATTKRTTYYYINTCPQWQVINGGNWKSVEYKIRKTAERYNSTFQVITGTYGVLSLADINNNFVQIFLVPGNRLPVPKFIWKIMYDKVTKNGIVIIVVNNPFVSNISEVDLLCQNICSQYGWSTTENWNDVSKGYVYCCDLDSFFRKVDTAPSLTVRGILRGTT